MRLMDIIGKTLYRILLILALILVVSGVIHGQFIYVILGIFCLIIAALLYHEEKEEREQ